MFDERALGPAIFGILIHAFQVVPNSSFGDAEAFSDGLIGLTLATQNVHGNDQTVVPEIGGIVDGVFQRRQIRGDIVGIARDSIVWIGFARYPIYGIIDIAGHGPSQWSSAIWIGVRSRENPT